MTVPGDASREDFDAYVAARRTALVRSAVLMGCSPHDAEDLVQVTLARCLPRWDRIASDRPDAYVYRVLLNSFRDSRRRRWTGEHPTEQLPEPPLTTADPTTGLAVRAALAAMTKDHREVLVLRFYADLSEAETRRVLPPGTASAVVLGPTEVTSCQPQGTVTLFLDTEDAIVAVDVAADTSKRLCGEEGLVPPE